jgi:hypothetical protein
MGLEVKVKWLRGSHAGVTRHGERDGELVYIYNTYIHVSKWSMLCTSNLSTTCISSFHTPPAASTIRHSLKCLDTILQHHRLRRPPIGHAILSALLSESPVLSEYSIFTDPIKSSLDTSREHRHPARRQKPLTPRPWLPLPAAPLDKQ